jgi:hypothetical protein
MCVKQAACYAARWRPTSPCQTCRSTSTAPTRHRIPISVSTALLRDENGRVVGGVETFQDISAIKELRKALRRQHSFEDIVSKNPGMFKIFSLLPQVAESGSTVLIEGASGTGKELIARALHHHSPHRSGPFVAVNCGALPDTLIESELFGYKAGAFTDARQDKPGRFRPGPERHDLPGRDRRHLPRRPGAAAAGAPAEGLRAARLRQARPHQRPDHRRHPPRPQPAGPGGEIQRGPLLPDQRVQDRLPALSERKEDIPLLVDSFHRTVQPPEGPLGHRALSGGDGRPDAA